MYSIPQCYRCYMLQNIQGAATASARPEHACACANAPMPLPHCRARVVRSRVRSSNKKVDVDEETSHKSKSRFYYWFTFAIYPNLITLQAAAGAFFYQHQPSHKSTSPAQCSISPGCPYSLIRVFTGLASTPLLHSHSQPDTPCVELRNATPSLTTITHTHTYPPDCDRRLAVCGFRPFRSLVQFAVWLRLRLRRALFLLLIAARVSCDGPSGS